MNIIHILLSFATNLNWLLQQFNVKNAFVQVDLEEEVHIEIQLGLEEDFNGNKVYRLKKAL